MTSFRIDNTIITESSLIQSLVSIGTGVSVVHSSDSVITAQEIRGMTSNRLFLDTTSSNDINLGDNSYVNALYLQQALGIEKVGDFKIVYIYSENGDRPSATISLKVNGTGEIEIYELGGTVVTTISIAEGSTLTGFPVGGAVIIDISNIGVIAGSGMLSMTILQKIGIAF